MPDDAAPPDLLPGLSWVWEAFWDLDTTRGWLGPGTPGPIPWTALDAWSRRAELDDEAHHALVTLVAAMDRTFRESMARRLRQDTSKDTIA